MQEVVLSRRAENPWVAQVPAEIRDAVGVATVHEKAGNMLAFPRSMTTREDLQFGWPILSVLWGLFLSCSAEIPEHDLTIVTGAGQDGLFKRMPRNRLHRVGVAFERVQFRLEIPQIPQTDGLVGRTSGQDCLGSRIERDRVDGVTVLALGRGSGASGVSSTNVENLKCDVIRNGTDQRRVQWVVLDIVHNRGMVGVGASWTKGFVALSVGGQVPAFDVSICLNQRVLQHTPETDGLIFTTSSKVTSFMGVPTESKALSLMAQKLHLRVHGACGNTGVL